MADVAFPPQYTRYSRTGLAPASIGELPAYTRRNTLAAPLQPPRQPTEHTFPLISSSTNKAWACLRLSSSAKSAKSLPTFYEKEKINGSVDINLGRADSVSAVSLRVSHALMLNKRRSAYRLVGHWTDRNGCQ